MSPIDTEAFSVMVTVELSRLFAGIHKFRHDGEATAFYTKAMTRLLKSGSLSKKTHRYFLKSLAPAQPGFERRWHLRLDRYSEIRRAEKILSGKTDLERLKLSLATVSEGLGVVTKVGVGDQVAFAKDEQLKVKENGFLALTQKELDGSFTEDGAIKNIAYLSVYSPAFEKGLRILRTLQTFGFSLHKDKTDLPVKRVGFIALIGGKGAG